MVDKTAEAVTARLIATAEAGRHLLGRPGPQAVSMSSEAVTQRLREWAELTRLCLLLDASRHSGTGATSSSDSRDEPPPSDR